MAATADPAIVEQPGDPAAPHARDAIVARGIALRGGRGAVFGPLDLDIAPGTLTVLQAPQGGGRTSLLLTLAGRMAPSDGTLTVGGRALPRGRRAVQREVAVAGFAGIDELDESLTVGALVRERIAWLTAWRRRTPRTTQAQLDAVLAPAFGPRPAPRLDDVVWDLDEVDLLLTRIGLALAQRPRALVVDDIDQVHDDERRQLVWSRLEALAATGLTVVAACASADEVERMAWEHRPGLVRLGTGPRLHHAQPTEETS